MITLDVPSGWVMRVHITHCTFQEHVTNNHSWNIIIKILFIAYYMYNECIWSVLIRIQLYVLKPPGIKRQVCMYSE